MVLGVGATVATFGYAHTGHRRPPRGLVASEVHTIVTGTFRVLELPGLGRMCRWWWGRLFIGRSGQWRAGANPTDMGSAPLILGQRGFGAAYRIFAHKPVWIVVSGPRAYGPSTATLSDAVL